MRVLAVGDEGFGTYEWDGGRLTPSGGDAEGILAPGFVDGHIHGGYGTDLLTATVAELKGLADRLRRDGYEWLWPTTLTAPVELVRAAVLRWREVPMFAGFHLEGPFISPKHPGAQPKEAIEPVPGPDSPWNELLDDPDLRLVTLAPEIPGGLELTRRLAGRGVTVAMGHTDATYAQAREAADAGARRTTHTYNAMRPLHHREAGTVGFALLDERITAELIYDRVHVSPEAARVLLRMKGPDGVVAVSDATMAAGLPPGTDLDMWGLSVRVDETSVRLHDGTLAGSRITLRDAFRNLTQDFGAEWAIRLCAINPRRGLKLSPPKAWNLFDLEGELREQV